VAGAAVLVSWLLRRQTPGPSVVTTATLVGQPPGSPAPAAPTVLSLRQLALRGLPSTVALRCPSSVASGFFVAPELVLTNAHALCPGGQSMEVTFSDGQKLMASVSSSDAQLDLAVLRVPLAKAPPLPLGDIGMAAVGDMVAFIGSPMGLDFTVHEGTISSLSRSARGVALIQLDAKVNPGNSGGPLLDDQGRVIGIVTMKHAQAEGIGLAVPINYAYGGDHPLLKTPTDSTPSAGFDAMVTRARAEGREEEPEVAASEPLTGLAGASIDPYRNLMVHILRAAGNEPAFAMVTIKVWSGSEEICTLKGDVMQVAPDRRRRHRAGDQQRGPGLGEEGSARPEPLPGKDVLAVAYLPAGASEAWHRPRASGRRSEGEQAAVALARVFFASPNVLRAA
jgi:hypothetical protein